MMAQLVGHFGRSTPLVSPAPDADPTPRLNGADPYEWAFSNSPAMRRVGRMVERVAPTNATVLMWGESGAGKEVVARAIHHYSPRLNRAFVKINCAALPAELLESELFGYERGAFTGAHRQKPGKFELANGGSVFLDEIGEMPLPLQAKLLHILEDREVARLGGQRNVRIDVRMLAATNKNLAMLAQQGQFREDLYYRLNVMAIYVPPLRERPQEIPILVDRLLGEYAAQYERPRPSITAETLRLFLDYPWPGNVRELQNLVKRIVVLGSQEWIVEAMTSPAMPRARSAASPAEGAAAPSRRRTPTLFSGSGDGPSLKEIGRRAAFEAEADALRHVLDTVHWHRLEAARRLRVSYKTLLQKMKQSGLADRPETSAS